jgi:hypothetical protein
MAARKPRGATAAPLAGWRPANDAAALAALAGQLSGSWKVWYTHTAPHWRAAPGNADMTTADAIALGGVVAADTPEQLAAECDRRYGWGATCTACNRPARDCGHRLRTDTTPAR